MARASTRLDGITAPVEIGFSIQERINLTSSSGRRLFFSTRADEVEGIDARARGCEGFDARSRQKKRGGPRRNYYGYRDQGRGSRWPTRLATAPTPKTIQKLFDSTEETGRFRLRFFRRQLFELRQQFTLRFG